MMRTLANGAVGVASAVGTWVVGTLNNVELIFRVVGVIAGALTACVALATAIRNWRKGK